MVAACVPMSEAGLRIRLCTVMDTGAASLCTKVTSLLLQCNCCAAWQDGVMRSLPMCVRVTVYV